MPCIRVAYLSDGMLAVLHPPADLTSQHGLQDAKDTGGASPQSKRILRFANSAGICTGSTGLKAAVH